MSAAATATVIDFIQPDKAKDVGGELAVSTTTLVGRLHVVSVTDVGSCQQAVLDRQALGEATKRVEEFFAPFKKMAHQLHKALCDRETEILAPVRALDNQKRVAIGAFKEIEDRAREARERAIAEQRRQDEQTRAALEAARLERAGEHLMAAAVIEEAIAAPEAIVVLPDTTAQVDGLKFTTRHKWRYLNGPSDVDQTPPAIRARAMQLIPRDYLCVDEQKVGAMVRAAKGLITIPGIEIYTVKDPVR